MPRDLGYSTLPALARAKEDQVLRGPVACHKCHGDPDGAGPLAAPAQGDLHASLPLRRTCGSCHDDVDWELPYVSNGLTMPADSPDGSCAACHVQADDDLSVRRAHVHPLLDPETNPGLRVLVASVGESGADDGDGRLDPGEKVAVTFSLTTDAGAPVDPASAALSTAVSGPSWNANLLLSTSVPSALLTGPPPWTVNLPQQVLLEWVGDATIGLDAFSTARAPHLAVTGAPTVVYERTATGGGSSTSLLATDLFQNHVDVADTAGFARNDWVVVEDGTPVEEYAQVLLVEGSRLWLNVPLRSPHPAGATVQEVVLTARTAGVHYVLTPSTGTITEGPVPFGVGNAVVVTYWSDFLVPALYPPPTNDSPELGETSGEWTGKPLVSGTYTVALWGSVNRVVNYDRTLVPSAAAYPDSTTYRGTSPPANVDVLVGDATAIEPYAVIPDASTCAACHDDLWFHGGGRRGFGTCIVCHGAMGMEDRPRYVAANAPPTPGLSVTFREMLHSIHRGADLVDDYVVVGFGAAPYPNNFSLATYEHVRFPAQPGGVKQCAKCHDGAETWKEPPPRDHPSAQGFPVRVWGPVCVSCHDSDAARAHVATMTSPAGVESCVLCHGAGQPYAVETVHVIR